MARRLFMLAWLALVGVVCPSIIQADDPPSALQDAATRARLTKGCSEGDGGFSHQ
jgi:hypothetical protein